MEIETIKTADGKTIQIIKGDSKELLDLVLRDKAGLPVQFKNNLEETESGD